MHFAVLIRISKPGLELASVDGNAVFSVGLGYSVIITALISMVFKLTLRGIGIYSAVDKKLKLSLRVCRVILGRIFTELRLAKIGEPSALGVSENADALIVERKGIAFGLGKITEISHSRGVYLLIAVKMKTVVHSVSGYSAEG